MYVKKAAADASRPTIQYNGIPKARISIERCRNQEQSCVRVTVTKVSSTSFYIVKTCLRKRRDESSYYVGGRLVKISVAMLVMDETPINLVGSAGHGTYHMENGYRLNG